MLDPSGFVKNKSGGNPPSLRSSALTDALAALYNRCLAMDHPGPERVEADRGLRSLAVLMLDSDHFKAVNDPHGHDAGDEFRLIAPDASYGGDLPLAERAP